MAAAKPNELRLIRVYDAPAKLVWTMWTEDKHVTKWWGPRGFTLTTKSKDVRPGGKWIYTMHGPDGTDYPNKVIFLEVVKPERLVYKHASDDETENVNFHVTVTFEAAGDKTKLEMRSVFESKEELARVEEKYGAIEGAKQTVSRLEQYLLQMHPALKGN